MASNNPALPPGFNKDQAFGMAETEMEYRVELFNRLTQTCFNKCIDRKYKDSELNMGENSCIDRCVSKYWLVGFLAFHCWLNIKVTILNFLDKWYSKCAAASLTYLIMLDNIFRKHSRYRNNLKDPCSQSLLCSTTHTLTHLHLLDLLMLRAIIKNIGDAKG